MKYAVTASLKTLQRTWLIAGVFALLGGPLFLLVQPAAAAIPDPLAAYSFDRMAMPTVFDDTNNGNEGTISNVDSVTQVAGHTNMGLQNGSSGRLVRFPATKLRPANQLTVMVWLKNSGGTFKRVLMTMPQSGTDDTTSAWTIWTGNGSNYYTASLTTTNGTVGLSTTITPDTSWHHLALTYDGANAKFYVDGALIDTQPATGTINYGAADQPMTLFSTILGNSTTIGIVDDARVYDQALSQANIQTLMNAPVLSQAPNRLYNRSFTLSNSRPGATGVTYDLSMKVSHDLALSTIVMDMCSQSPLPGQTCSTPAGLVPPTMKCGAIRVNGTLNGRSFVPVVDNGRTVKCRLTNGTIPLVKGDVVTLSSQADGTNPSSLGTFYARVFFYTTDTQFTAYTSTAPGVYNDFGGFALATANGVGMTFQVPESLTFCVYKTTCGDVPSLTLGHGPKNVIDTSQIDTAAAKVLIGTNAQYGATIFAQGDLLRSGTAAITPIDNGSGTATTMVPGTEAFGLKISPPDGTIAAAYAYRDWGGDDYAFYSPMTSGAVAVTRQDTPGPINNQVLTITFGVTASPDTPAGVYTTSINLVAAATF